MGYRKIYYLGYASFIMMLIVTLSSCNQSPVEESLRTVDNAIEKIEKAQDIYELMGIANTLKSDLNAINAANKDYKPTRKESEEIKNKLNELMRIYLKRTSELSLGNTEYGEQSQEIIDKMLPQQK